MRLAGLGGLVVGVLRCAWAEMAVVDRFERKGIGWSCVFGVVACAIVMNQLVRMCVCGTIRLNVNAFKL